MFYVTQVCRFFSFVVFFCLAPAPHPSLFVSKMVGGSTGFTAAVGAGLVHFFMKCLSEVLAPRCFLKKNIMVSFFMFGLVGEQFLLCFLHFFI